MESNDILGNVLRVGYRVMYHGKVYEIGNILDDGETLLLTDMSEMQEIPVSCAYVRLV